MHAPAFKVSTSTDWQIVAAGGDTRYEKEHVISSIAGLAVQSLLEIKTRKVNTRAIEV
jgi:hypothetical protein